MNPSRPPLWKRLLRFTIFSGVVLVTLLALGLSWFSFTTRREWAKTKAELLARGEKLSLVELAPPPIPDDQNFFADPIWRPAEVPPGRPAIKETPFQLLNTRITPAEKAESQSLFPHVNLTGSPSRSDAAYQLGRVLAGLPSNVQPAGAALIERLLAPLAPVPPKIESLLDRGNARFPFDYATLPWKMDPYSGFHQIGQTLTTFAYAALYRGDPATAARLTQDLLRMSDTLAKEPLLYAQMLRISLIAQGRTLIQTGLEEHRWNDKELQPFQNALAQIDLLPGLALAYRTERGRTNQAFEAIFLPSKDLADLVEQLPTGLRQAFPIYFRLFGFNDRVALNWGVQKIVDALEAAPRNGLDSRSYRYVPGPLDRLTQVFANNFFYLLGGQVDVVAVHMTDIRQTVVACALERYRLECGSYPKSLAELVPAYLPAIPCGIIVLEPLHYRRLSPETFRLWAEGRSPEEDIVWEN